jgi:hypothetical protein
LWVTLIIIEPVPTILGLVLDEIEQVIKRKGRTPMNKKNGRNLGNNIKNMGRPFEAKIMLSRY